MSGSQVMYLNTSFEIVVESTLEEHHHEEDPEYTTKENYHWTAQQEKVPPPTPQQRHPVYFGSEDFFLIVANQSRFCLNPWWPTWRPAWSWRNWAGSTWWMGAETCPPLIRSPSHIFTWNPLIIDPFPYLNLVWRWAGRNCTWSVQWKARRSRPKWQEDQRVVGPRETSLARCRHGN